MEWSLIQKKVHHKVGYADIHITHLMLRKILCGVKGDKHLTNALEEK